MITPNHLVANDRDLLRPPARTKGKVRKTALRSKRAWSRHAMPGRKKDIQRDITEVIDRKKNNRILRPDI